MHGLLCEECNIFIRGNHRKMKEHKKTQKHKQNHKKFILQKHLESKKNKIFSKLDFIEKKQKQARKKIPEKTQIITKNTITQDFQNLKPSQKIIWQKKVDFSKNQIIFENLITGKKTTEIPFGLDPDLIPTIGVDSNIPYITNNWTDVKKKENFFEKNKFEKIEKFKKKKDLREIEGFWIKGGGSVKKAVFEFLEDQNDFDCKFEKLELLAKKNVELDLKEDNIVQEKEKGKVDHGLFRKRKIKKR